MNTYDDDKAIRNFIIIFVIVILMVFGIYMLTKYVIVKDNNSNNEETKEVEINNDVAIVGTMLSKVEENYYVMLYKEDDIESGKYLTAKSSYSATEKALPVYTVDLSNALNSKFYDKDNVKLDSENVNDLRFGDFTVLEVKNGKIVKSYTDLDKVKKVWKVS